MFSDANRCKTHRANRRSNPRGRRSACNRPREWGGVRLAIAQESGEGEERTERKERKEARERAYLVGVAAGASFGACPALQ